MVRYIQAQLLQDHEVLIKNDRIPRCSIISYPPRPGRENHFSVPDRQTTRRRPHRDGYLQDVQTTDSETRGSRPYPRLSESEAGEGAQEERSA